MTKGQQDGFILLTLIETAPSGWFSEKRVYRKALYKISHILSAIRENESITRLKLSSKHVDGTSLCAVGYEHDVNFVVETPEEIERRINDDTFSSPRIRA